MLLSKHQLSVHSYRPLIQFKFFTIGLSQMYAYESHSHRNNSFLPISYKKKEKENEGFCFSNVNYML